MWIYVVSKRSDDNSWVHAAYTNEDQVKRVIEELNKEEEEKFRIYNEWVVSDDYTKCPEFGDYTYTYNKVWLDQ